MKPSEVLHKVGWCQGKLFDTPHDPAGGFNPVVSIASRDPDITSVCLVGAFVYAYGYDDRARIAQQDRFKEDMKIGSLVEWNDDPRRTKEEVIQALEACGL